MEAKKEAARRPLLRFESVNDGTFALENADRVSDLYFPLANEEGMMSCVTPLLAGDAKTGQSRFLLAPVSVEDLHASRSTRNFWVWREGLGAWSAFGQSAAQTAARARGGETCRVEAGFLWQTVTRESAEFGLRAETTTLVPCGDTVELTRVRLTNISPGAFGLVPTAAVPIYARSADNIRDHRHVTSLLQRIGTGRFGVEVRPTLLFDERGHRVCATAYAVLGAEGDGEPPVGFFPVLHRFIGEGGTLDWPEAVTENREPEAGPGFSDQGEEAMGGLRFAPVTLGPGETAEYILALWVDPKDAERFLSTAGFERALAENRRAWQEKLGVRFETGNREFDLWMRWVACEPVLRRIFGCSFLPHHDYGRGGRGWRDLWQDCLALLLTDSAAVGEKLWRYCAGMRIDGTNATIIGGEGGDVQFAADRNNIARVWMDHAAWPLQTIALYLDETGDLGFLLRSQTYFRDAWGTRCRETDAGWNPASGTELPVRGGGAYRGTVLEHLLTETLAACCNVGEHGMLRLENADWNDALDMAAQRGESVAFSSMYVENLNTLAGLLRALAARKTETVELAQELAGLLDGLGEDESPSLLRERLSRFCACVRNGVSGRTLRMDSTELAAKLEGRAARLAALIRAQEQVRAGEYRWLNGYYDNDGQPVERAEPSVRMTLTGQVFAIRSGVADKALAADMAAAAEHFLFAPKLGGFRLNTDFKELKLNLGRQFGFAYGHKENGAVFSHMAVMYGNALYRRGMVREGRLALKTLIAHSMDFEKSRIYPGIPEYFGPDGRGRYHYLTGAASWLILTLRCEVFGIAGRLGDLTLRPKFLAEDFANGDLRCETVFRGKRLRVIYRNPQKLEFGEYAPARVLLDGRETASGDPAVVPASVLDALAPQSLHTVEVTLAKKPAEQPSPRI